LARRDKAFQLFEPVLHDHDLARTGQLEAWAGQRGRNGPEVRVAEAALASPGQARAAPEWCSVL
jgi:hypothetical protein